MFLDRGVNPFGDFLTRPAARKATGHDAHGRTHRSCHRPDCRARGGSTGGRTEPCPHGMRTRFARDRVFVSTFFAYLLASLRFSQVAITIEI
jgi:hypothetical protein